MPLILDPRPQAGDLMGRLADLRGCLRRSTIFNGVTTILAIVTGLIAIAIWLDLVFHVPSVVRAYLLAIIVVTTILLAYRTLVRPLRAIRSDIDLALRVEHQFPQLDDSLASAVLFEQTKSTPIGSSQLRRATQHYAINRSFNLDFRDVTDRRSVVRSILAGFIAFTLAAPLLWQANLSLAAMRLADPFGVHPWPTATLLTVTAPSEIARGESFEIHVKIEGAVPDRAVLEFVMPGTATKEQIYPLTPRPNGGEEQFLIKLEASRVPRSFQYRLTANDSTTGWRSVSVHVPPELVALDGRPSPQMKLEFPSYTDLAPVVLPDGAGAVQAVLGTRIHVSAAIDRPVTSASISIRGNEPSTIGALIGLPMAVMAADSAFGFLPASMKLASPSPLQLSESGTHVAGSFVPHFGGVYDLCLTDAAGLSGHFKVDVRVLVDPSPSVHLERPSTSLDSLELAPTASFALKGMIEDTTFAIRRIAIEYRTTLDEPVRRIPIYDGDLLGRALAHFLNPLPEMRLRPSRLELDRQVSLSTFRHVDGKPLGIGDVLTFCIVAEDFDDVSPDKPPGRSHDVEIRILSNQHLEVLAQKNRAELAAALRELLVRQDEASKLTSTAQRERHASGRLRPEDITALDKAENDQRQIHERLGDDREGIRALASRFARSIQGNPEASTSSRDRAEQLVNGLNRLTQDVMEPIGPLIASARKESDSVSPDQRSRGPLPEAVRRQADAIRSLQELAELAEAGSDVASVVADAASLAAAQRQLAGDREQLSRTLPPGSTASSLSPDDHKQLDQLQTQQESLSQQAQKLTEKLDAMSEKSAIDASSSSNDAKRKEAEALAAAQQLARGTSPKQPADSLANQMSRAAKSIGDNHLGDAQLQQDAAARTLDKIREALRESDQPNLEKLLKDRTRAEDNVDRLTKEQESLREQIRSATEIADPAERKTQFERLAREQERLAKKAQELARELSRNGQSDAAREMNRAAQSMDQARDELEQGRNPDDAQSKILDHLDDAGDRAQQARMNAQEQLQREKALKFSQRLTGLTDRQASLDAEGERLFQAAVAGSGWSRTLLKSLTDLAKDEQGLAKEIEQLGLDHLVPQPVLKRLAEQASEALSDTAATIDDLRSSALKPETLEADRAAIRKPQQLAMRRLRQLQALIKPPEEKSERNSSRGGGQSSDSPSRPAQSEPIPATAQLQAIRELQAELNERTESLHRKQPDVTKWSDADRAELDSIRRAQSELVELLQSVTPNAPPPSSGEKK